MRDLFCNECGLSSGIPHLVAERLLGVEYLHRIEDRYDQMRKCYNYSYTEWQSAFTDELKPFGGYDNTTAVTVPIGNCKLGLDIKALQRGAIGVDLPTWFNIKEDNKHIMIVAQDPLRSNKWYGECHDAVLSSPYGQQDFEHRQKGNGGKMMHKLIEELTNSGYGVYLTDANKYFIYDHETTDEFAANHADAYTAILREEMDIVNPIIVVSLGRRAENMCKTAGITDVLTLPNMTGTARGAIIKRFPILEESGATADNIAKAYANEIKSNLN